MNTPYTSLLYYKIIIVVYRGKPIFLIFDPKHRLWVCVRTALVRRFLRVPTINVLSKSIKNIKMFPVKLLKKLLYIEWTSFRNELHIQSFSPEH